MHARTHAHTHTHRGTETYHDPIGVDNGVWQVGKMQQSALLKAGLEQNLDDGIAPAQHIKQSHITRTHPKEEEEEIASAYSSSSSSSSFSSFTGHQLLWAPLIYACKSKYNLPI